MERILALFQKLWVVAPVAPVATFDGAFLFFGGFAHAGFEAVVDAWRIGDDEGRSRISFCFADGFEGLIHISAESDLCDVDVAVGDGDHAEVFLLGLLAGGCEFGDGSSRSGLGGLSAGIGVDFSIEDEDIHIFAGSEDLIEAAEADVVCPAVAAEDPDGLLGDVLLALQDLSRLLAASSSSLLQLSDQGLCGLVVGLGVVLGSDELLVSSLQLCGCLVGTSNLSDLLDQVLTDGLLADVQAQAMLCVILEQGVAPCRTMAAVLVDGVRRDGSGTAPR